MLQGGGFPIAYVPATVGGMTPNSFSCITSCAQQGNTHASLPIRRHDQLDQGQTWIQGRRGSSLRPLEGFGDANSADSESHGRNADDFCQCVVSEQSKPARSGNHEPDPGKQPFVLPVRVCRQRPAVLLHSAVRPPEPMAELPRPGRERSPIPIRTNSRCFSKMTGKSVLRSPPIWVSVTNTTACRGKVRA